MSQVASQSIAIAAFVPAQTPRLVAALEREGYRAVVWPGVDEAVAALAGPPPDLVVAGVDPPDFAGWRLCSVMRSSLDPAWHRVPVLLVSANLAGDGSSSVTARLGGNGLLPSTASDGQFLNHVRGLLQGEPAAEGAIPAADDRFRRAVQDAGAGYFQIDADGNFVWVNDAWLRMHGYTQVAEIAGQHFGVTQVDQDLEKARAIVAQVMAGTRVSSGEFTRRRRDGSIGYHTFTAHPIREGERVAGVEGFLIDTTAFRRLEERYQMLFTEMLDGFALHEMIFDSGGQPVDYRFLAVNPAFEEMTGLHAKDIVGRTVLEVLPGTEAHWIENYGKVVLTGEPLRFESSHAGLHKHFDVYAFRPQEGQFACTFRDITELKARVAEVEQLAEKMRKTAEDYRAIFEGALEGIFQSTPDGRALAANPALAKMLGYDDEPPAVHAITSIGSQIWANPEERPPFLRLVEEQGFVRGHECRFRRKDGSIVWASLSCRKVSGPDGKTDRYEGFVEDITARKKAEEQLRTSESKFRMAFMTGADAFTLATLGEGMILEVNDRFSELYGYSRDEAVGKTVVELGMYPDSDRDRLLAELKAKGHVENMAFRTRRKDGELRSTLLSVSAQPGDRGELILVAARDVTEQMRIEEERVKLEDQFRQAQKLESIGRLAGGVAHDFNNLLTVINGYSDLLLGEYQGGHPLRAWVEEIRRAGDRAVNLTRQLLTFSRKQIVEPGPVVLHNLIAENQSMLQRLIGEEIELAIESDPAEWPVLADPGQLHQVLMNLTVNAVDAMPRGGTLTLRTANVEADEGGAAHDPSVAPGQYVSLQVSDTGVGIAKEIQQRIFDPFFTTKAEGEGTGLGLSTVYGIVRQLGGTITVSSEPGHGATFEIRLPRLECQVAAGCPVRAASVPARGSETILVVEDQDPVRSLAVAALRKQGYNTLDAASPADALLVAERHAGPIHLLLTDVAMPHMTGRELAGRMKPLRPETKVLYMSGYATDVIFRRALLDSAATCLAKPFTPDALAAKVREVLGPPKPCASILVVDDEPGVRGFFQQVLEGAGYQVAVARDGAEALYIVRERSFDLLLTDLVMPEHEGLEIIAILRKERPGLKVVAVSGAFGGAFLKAAELLGAQATLLKPVPPDRLLAAVQQALA